MAVYEHHFIPLDQFELNYRFTDENYNLLPADVLKSIKPLSPEKAKEIHVESLKYFSGQDLNPSLFKSVENMDVESHEKALQSWIHNHCGISNEIVISWNLDICVLTNTSILAQYCSDFCYPSSDDVCIFPLSREWVLYFSHSNCFHFGMLKI